MKILLVTPPFLQPNAPYPAMAYLQGFLKQAGYATKVWDASIESLVLLLSKSEFLNWAERLKGKHPSVLFAKKNKSEIAAWLDSVVEFLQGNNQCLASLIIRDLPQGPKALQVLAQMDELHFFGTAGLKDKAQFLATLFIEDVAAAFQNGVDSAFELIRYGESISASQKDYSQILKCLNDESSYLSILIRRLTLQKLNLETPDVVGITVPFPGNLIPALHICRQIRQQSPQTTIVMGGGFINTELREMSDPRLFDDVDYVVLDDGEVPLLKILKEVELSKSQPVQAGKSLLVRTFVRKNTVVTWMNSDLAADKLKFRSHPGPDYSGSPFASYLSMVDLLNPVHRLWNDGRWNKMMLAHGCYWSQCTFCDTSLDYIKRYDPDQADQVVNKIKNIQAQTGSSGFHFVDEAAPPALLKKVCEKILEQDLKIAWWGNLRFEEAFLKIAEVMARAGCLAVTGGLEVASDRVLKLIGKGVTLEQVVRVTRTFQKHGIQVHAYLMYGFPTQTLQEAIDSLEVVRQLFLQNCLSSAFWHRFVATVHSPVGKDPEKFKIKVFPTSSSFAKNDLPHHDPVNVPWDDVGKALKHALYNYLHGQSLDVPVHEWFDWKVPRSTVPTRFVQRICKDLD